MNEATKAYIKECGSSIRKYWELHPEDRAYYPQGGRKRNLKKLDESIVHSIE